MPAEGRWLFKEEPSHYSYERLVEDGGTVWDGVRNSLALKHLRSVRIGDLIMYYHTGEERAVVGIMSAESDAIRDPSSPDGRDVVLRVRPVRRLGRPVSLAEIKGDPRLRSFELVRLPRLSVMPVPRDVWEAIVKMSES